MGNQAKFASITTNMTRPGIGFNWKDLKPEDVHTLYPIIYA